MADRITLRYFDARGRAQFIRYYLSVRNLDFTDERIPIEADFSSWLDIKDDSELTGPFKKLPVLNWNDTQFSEALVIADTLHERCGDAALLGATENLRHRQLISHLYGDVVYNLGTTIWSDIIFRGLDFPAFVRSSADRIASTLLTLDTTLQKWEWVRHSNMRPLMLADCLLWECIDASKLVFGEYIDDRELPVLNAIHERYAKGTAFSALLTNHPCRFTARFDETDVLARIKAALE